MIRGATVEVPKNDQLQSHYIRCSATRRRPTKGPTRLPKWAHGWPRNPACRSPSRRHPLPPPVSSFGTALSYGRPSPPSNQRMGEVVTVRSTVGLPRCYEKELGRLDVTQQTGSGGGQARGCTEAVFEMQTCLSGLSRRRRGAAGFQFGFQKKCACIFGAPVGDVVHQRSPSFFSFSVQVQLNT